MQCNSINVVEESMMMSRSGHTPEMEMSRTPQTPNSESQLHRLTLTVGVLLIIHLRLIVELGCSNTTVKLAEFVRYY